MATVTQRIAAFANDAAFVEFTYDNVTRVISLFRLRHGGTDHKLRYVPAHAALAALVPAVLPGGDYSASALALTLRMRQVTDPRDGKKKLALPFAHAVRFE